MTDAVERMRASKLAYQEQRMKDGREAGISFAANTEYVDLLIFRKVYDTDYDDDDLLDLLFIEYSDRCDYSDEEFGEHLFRDEDAKPSGDFVDAFSCAALETLEGIAEQAAAAE